MAFAYQQRRNKYNRNQSNNSTYNHDTSSCSSCGVTFAWRSIIIYISTKIRIIVYYRVYIAKMALYVLPTKNFLRGALIITIENMNFKLKNAYKQ